MTLQNTETSTQSSREPLKEGFRPLGGAIYGVVAFVATFILTTGYFTFRVTNETGSQFGLDEAFPVAQFVGYPFYNAHNVNTPIEFTSTGAVGTQIGMGVDSYFAFFNQLSAVTGFSINPLVFNAIPAVILLLTGYIIAGRVTTPLSLKGSAVAGASVAVGYLPLFVLGAPLFRTEGSEFAAGPEIGVTLVFFGALFAVGFGGLGGYLRAKRASGR